MPWSLHYHLPLLRIWNFSYSLIFYLQHSVQFSCSVLSDSLGPHGLQHTRFLCPSQIPGACSNSRPSSWWCHPTISSPLSSPSPTAFNLSQHQGLFQWLSSLRQVTKVLVSNTKHIVISHIKKAFLNSYLLSLLTLSCCFPSSNELSICHFTPSLSLHSLIHFSLTSSYRSNEFFLVFSCQTFGRLLQCWSLSPSWNGSSIFLWSSLTILFRLPLTSLTSLLHLWLSFHSILCWFLLYSFKGVDALSSISQMFGIFRTLNENPASFRFT